MHINGLLDLYINEKSLNDELQIRYKIENDKYKIEKEKNKKQDTEINKLNNAIDRMAKKLSQVPMYHFKSKSNIYSSDNIDLVAMSVDEIKDYFMDMERRGEYE